MKYLILFTLICFSLSLFAQNSLSSKFDQDSLNDIAIKNYEICLTHENEGVVESAIGNVLRFKYRHPDTNLDSIEYLLFELSESYKIKRIREKALLVSQILKNPALVSEIGNNFYKDIHQFLEVMLVGGDFKSTDKNQVSRNES
ncbi:hypothetical protein ACFLSX_05020, partial [Calditrichota bacterium]